MNYLLNPPPVVWPLLVLLLLLFFVHRISDEGKPIFRGIVAGLAKSATANAVPVAIAVAFGLSASLSAFIDVFKDMSAPHIDALSWHQYAVLWAKVLNPFVVAILAYATQNKFNTQAGTGETIATTSTTAKTTISQGPPSTP